MRYDPDEREDVIATTLANYKSGEFGETRAKTALHSCGLNATEIEELISPFRAVAFELWKKGRSS